VLAADQKLLGVVSFRELFDAAPGQRLRDILRPGVVTVTDQTPQREVSELFRMSSLLALPVVDAEGRMQGIITADDIVHVLAEEATNEIQRIGGSEALGAPYLEIAFPTMVRKRAGCYRPCSWARC
jgi:magnesium transporter